MPHGFHRRKNPATYREMTYRMLEFGLENYAYLENKSPANFKVLTAIQVTSDQPTIHAHRLTNLTMHVCNVVYPLLRISPDQSRMPKLDPHARLLVRHAKTAHSILPVLACLMPSEPRVFMTRASRRIHDLIWQVKENDGRIVIVVAS
jgi:hypothetical protein